MKYRSEIDGLRALAVIPVILFHAGFELFSGGYVGVDVFFVISGYLITTILLQDLENNRFSIAQFYERRARRILPALFFVMLACIPFAWMWMPPLKLNDFSQSLAAVSFFSSNVLFWLEGGYFAGAAEEKPLLHTWSLAVEEQFYVLFPIFLGAAWRFGKNKVFWLIVLFAAASLALCEWGWRNEPTANFYLAPTRAWELLAGSIAAFIIQKRGVRSNETLSMLGLTAIVFSIFAYTKETPFPSLQTLVPVIGVVLVVLFAEKQTLTARLLSVKWMVGIGLISYSAYLWHQPLFAFARIRLPGVTSDELMTGLSVASLVLAYFSWKYIEQPFRNKTFVTYRHVVAFSVAGLTMFTAVGIFGHINNGFYHRIDGWERISAIPRVSSAYCHNEGRRTQAQLMQGDFCTIGKGEVNTVIIGDSHAGALFEYADEFLASNNVAAWAVSGGFCAPLLNGFEAGFGYEGGEACADITKVAFDKIIENPDITSVILVAEWANYTKGYRGKDAPQTWVDDLGAAGTYSENPDLFNRSLTPTIKALRDANKLITIVMPSPEFEYYPYHYVAQQILVNDSSVKEATAELPSISVDEYYSRNFEVFDAFGKLEGDLRFVEVKDLFCNEQRCYPHNGGEYPLYSDSNHLNYFGAEVVVNRIFETLPGKWAEPLSKVVY